ncbi:hypothetical protein JL2886_03173 [Phaeobacter gallaeciensis]|uniref:Uncharacterized protein n=1 Tax=Phaeobacter gallaeciensis TaxID=60890 RepID=A0A1B0ZVA9_9RHOB|nr:MULTISPECIES: hypothetical protein [Phaeobacter]MEE2633651.1 hypothetical protein [Pseudomonadota bacterium]ANP38059.1 hypothetical protein JL2886_03173 [Phaeobacter gallaeciensis]MDE4060496.1 hypothetical protein [Phaeobacter gallaeciensis]MDE4123700.1 hypothetical protein [Phaeobacter gallaeciensis]MDE4127985.1 hypothetical protein [Phaeobacter gallaeciensis]
MALAGIMMGTLTGFFSALFSLVVLGHSVWTSLLVYSGVGIATALVLTIAVLLRNLADAPHLTDEATAEA